MTKNSADQYVIFHIIRSTPNTHLLLFPFLKKKKKRKAFSVLLTFFFPVRIAS